MALPSRFIALLLLPVAAWCQQAAKPASAASMPSPATSPAVPVSAIWAGEWKAIDFNIPPADRTLTTRRDPASLKIWAVLAGTDCPLGYDGVLQSADIIRRIEDRAKFQMDAANWPAGTDPSQFVGLKKEFEQALRITRTLPPDNYRRTRAACPGAKPVDDRFYILNEGKRLFEFRFPENGLSLSVTLYERTR